jgi:hypothetical protein
MPEDNHVVAAPEIQPAPLPASITQQIPYTPARYADAAGRFPDDAPVYLYKTPSRRDQIAFATDLEHEVAIVSDTLTRETLRDAADALLTGPARDQVREAIDRWEEFDEDADTADADERETVTAKVNVFHRRATVEFPPYRALVAQRGKWTRVRRLMAVERFLVGRTTMDDREYARVVPYARERGVVTDEAMDTIPPADLEIVGDFAALLSLLRPTQKKS